MNIFKFILNILVWFVSVRLLGVMSSPNMSIYILLLTVPFLSLEFFTTLWKLQLLCQRINVFPFFYLLVLCKHVFLFLFFNIF